MLTATELAQMRSDVALLLPDTGHILSKTLTSDGAGGITETWGTATANVPCRVDYKTGKETQSSGALVPFQTAIISFASSVTITPANRVQIGANTFSIQSVNNGQSCKAVTRCSAELVP